MADILKTLHILKCIPFSYQLIYYSLL